MSWSRPRRPLSFLCFAAERRAASGHGCLCVSKVIGWVGGVWWETTLAAQILGVLVPGGNCARSRARAQIEPEPASDHSFPAQGPQQRQPQPRGQRTPTIPRCREHERKSQVTRPIAQRRDHRTATTTYQTRLSTASKDPRASAKAAAAARPAHSDHSAMPRHQIKSQVTPPIAQRRDHRQRPRPIRRGSALPAGTRELHRPQETPQAT